MASPDDRSKKANAEQAQPYVRPTLTLVGNMNDLLAAGGTKDADGGVCVVGGLETDPDACN
jgi:hypothetical protein